MNTATFSALYALAFRSHPLPESDRLVQLHDADGAEIDPGEGVADLARPLEGERERDDAQGDQRDRCPGADEHQLVSAVVNLLENAVKYSDGGPVVIRGRRHEGAVEVSVSDIGIGMDEEQARHCFDKFWQAESTDVRRFGGTGIGLYIVSSLVDAMGGTIAVETAVGRGCTFTVTLPEVEAPEPAAFPADPPGIKDFMRQVGALSRGNA